MIGKPAAVLLKNGICIIYTFDVSLKLH